MPKGNLWTLAVIAVVLAVLLPAANIAYADSTHQQTKTNESVTVSYTGTIQVSEDAFEYNDTVTLLNASGSELVDGTDYEWYPENGTLEYYNTTNTEEGNTNHVTYDYFTHDQATLDASFILDLFGDWSGILIMIAAIGALLGLLFRGTGGSSGGSF